MSDIDRIMKFIEPVTESGCWIWTGYLMPNGYGQFRYGGNAIPAHRVAFAIIRGYMPPQKIDLDHLCRVRCCVNPDHLEPVTRQVNLRRGAGCTLIGKERCFRGHDLATNLYYAGSKKAARCRECERIRDRTRQEDRKEQREVARLFQRMVERARASAALVQPNQ